MLSAFVVFAIFFAWFGNVYHRSRRQARSVDRLISQNAFVSYAPRQNTLVGLMPGDPQQPPVTLVRYLGDDFFSAVTNVSTANAGSTPVDKSLVLSAIVRCPAGLCDRLGATDVPVQRQGGFPGGSPWSRALWAADAGRS
jgi:hypothetical protein